MAGGILAEQQCYQRYFSEREQSVLEIVGRMQLSQSIQVRRDSKGRVVLLGLVDSKDLKVKLTAELIPIVGKRDANHAVISLDVKDE